MKSSTWLKNSVIYQIFVDRFAKGGQEEITPFADKTLDGKDAPGDIAPGHYLGGDLWGVIEKLDHIKALGANTIWLSPFNEGVSYHGYHITNFNKVDPRFGGEKAFNALVKEAHKRGMKIMMDFVPNHVSIKHPWFESSKNPNSPYRNWFYWEKNEKSEMDYKKFLWFGELAKLNLDNPECRKEVIGSMKFWMDRGVDGFRMDHVLGPSMDFWKQCRRELKAKNPEVVMIAEVWFYNINKGDLHTLHGLTPEEREHYHSIWDMFSKLQKRFDGKETKLADELYQEYGEILFNSPAHKYHEYFDGILDFGFQFLMQQRVKGALSKEELAKKLKLHFEQFSGNCISVPFLGNHDMDTLLWEAKGDERKIIEAVEILSKTPGAPVIYQGEEFGVVHKQLRSMAQAGVTGIPGQECWYGDLMVRAPIQWSKRSLATMIQVYQNVFLGRNTQIKEAEEEAGVV